jgi:hypothetical protein
MKKTLTIFFALFLVGEVLAQWSCPSKIGGNLKPLWSDSPIRWATEIETGGGVLGERALFNGMWFGALEYDFGVMNLYAEGGVKYWSLWENDIQLSKFRPGMRELYVEPAFKNLDVRIGLQSLQFDDAFIFNERAMAVSFDKKIQGFTFEGALGTVSKQFARNGTFCSKCFQYDIVMDKPQSFLGSKPFDEKFAAMVVTFRPGDYKKRKGITTQPNASGDEFEEFDAFEPVVEAEEKKSRISVDAAGLVLYSEFGQHYANPLFVAGFYESINLPLNLKFKGEYLFQHFGSTQGIVAVNSIDGSYKSKFGFTDINGSYYYFYKLSDQAAPMLSYTNLFLGEVLRLDVVEMPLASFYIKHRFKNKGMSLKLQYATEIKRDAMREIDLQWNKNIGHLLHVIVTGGWMHGGAVSDNTLLGRVELRVTF